MESIKRKLNMITMLIDTMSDKQKDEFIKRNNPSIIALNFQQLANVIGAIKNEFPEPEHSSEVKGQVENSK